MQSKVSIVTGVVFVQTQELQQSCRRCPLPPTPQILTDQLTLSQAGQGQIMPTTLILKYPSLEIFQTFLRPCTTRHCISTHGFKTISKIHYSRQQRSKAIRLPNELHENAFRNHLHLRNAPDQPKGRPTFAMAVCKCLWEVIIRGKLIFPLTFKLRSEASSDSS